MKKSSNLTPSYAWLAAAFICFLLFKDWVLENPHVNLEPAVERIWEVQVAQNANVQAVGDEEPTLQVRAKVLQSWPGSLYRRKFLTLSFKGSSLDWLQDREVLAGQVIRFKGRVFLPRGFANPGGQDAVRKMCRNGVSGRMTITKGPILYMRKEGNLVAKLLVSIERRREAIQQEIFSVLERNQASLISGLLLGFREDISPQTNRLFVRTGLSHVLAVSGAHVVTLLFFSYQMSTLLFRRSRLLNRFVSAQILCALINLPMIWFYVWLSGSSPSSIRAGLMISLFLLSKILGRGFHVLNILSVTAVLTLVYDSTNLWSISWQLSFAAVLAIVLGLQHTPKPKHLSLCSRLMQGFGLLFWVTVWATLGTLPLVLFHFGQISLVGFLANLIVVPWVSFVVMPLLFLSLFVVLICPSCPILYQYLWKIVGGTQGPLEALLAFLVKIPYAFIRFPPLQFHHVLALSLIIFLIIWVRSRKYKVLAAVLLVVALSFHLLFQWVSNLANREHFWIEFLDVGHGDAICLHLPGGKIMLVDAGGFAQSRFDVGKNIWLPYFRYRGIDRIDYMVVTHPHPDHFLGFYSLVGEIPIGEFWHNEDLRGGFGWDAFRQVLQEENILTQGISQDTQTKVFGPVTFRFLNPLPPDKRQNQNINNHSIVMEIGVYGRTLLLTGDVEKETERRIFEKFHFQKVDLLKVPHHGSLTSSSTGLLKALNPRKSIVSAGRIGRVHLPHPLIIKRYGDLSIPLYATENCGAIRYEISPEGQEKWTSWRGNRSGECLLEEEENDHEKRNADKKDNL